MGVTLTEFSYRTKAGAGLYSADPIKVLISFKLECSGIWCYLGWIVRWSGKLDGQTMVSERDNLTSIGTYGGADDVELVFSGVMPRYDISGEIVFELGRWGEQGVIAREKIAIANLDDITPPPDGPAVCTEGQTRCRDSEGTASGPHLWVCRTGTWVIKEYDSTQCGLPPPVYTCPYCGKIFSTQAGLNAHIAAVHGEIPPTCTVDSDCPEGYVCIGGECVKSGAAGWLEKYKWWIVGGAVAVIIAATVLLKRR